ncbi:MAG: hypothetical protein IPH57_09945 [Saprospiraceae bacterium]|nr:hypothetical protein [Saprospiraceae bacterium]
MKTKNEKFEQMPQGISIRTVVDLLLNLEDLFNSGFQYYLLKINVLTEFKSTVEIPYFLTKILNNEKY